MSGDYHLFARAGRLLISRGRIALAEVLAFLVVSGVLAISATACEGVGGPELTTLSTTLSGEGKEGTTITVLEGLKVKDKATLKGKNASTATGKVTYKVYSDNTCKTLVTAAGEVNVNGENVPASTEEELEGGKTYYWQAHYTGDSKNAESTSECNEVLNVKAIVCIFPYCEPTVTPGVELKVGAAEKECTAGPIMKNGAELLLLTAGHCIEEGKAGNIKEEVKSAYPNKGAPVAKRIGNTGTFANTEEYDIAEVKVENPEWLAGGNAPAKLVEWEGKPNYKIANIIGEAANKVGEKTCFTGATLGLVDCGVILRTGATKVTGVVQETKNLIESTADGIKGDSGSPEFVPAAKGVEIQGTYSGGGKGSSKGPGQLTINEKKITGYPTGDPTTCSEFMEMKKDWTSVPIKATKGILPNTTMTNCIEEPNDVSTLEMSNNATETANVTVTFGYEEVGWYEPMSQIKARYPGQTLLTK